MNPLTADQALEIMDAIENYGEAERMYGKKSQQVAESGDPRVPAYYNKLADHLLGVLGLHIRPLIDDPDNPVIAHRFSENIKPRPDAPHAEEDPEVKFPWEE